MKNVFIAVMAAVFFGLTGCLAGNAGAAKVGADKAMAGGTDEAIAQAEQELAAVNKMGHTWRLIDKATGGSSQDLDKLLAAAKKAREKGDAAEALRIANRVSESAKLGQRQAKAQANAAPHYPQ